MPWDAQVGTGSELGMQGGSFAFRITGTTNLPVVVQATSDLTQPDWTEIANYSLTGEPADFADPDTAGNPTRVYRIRPH